MAENSKSSQVDLAIVLGFIAVKDCNTLDKKISILSQLGFNNKEMAIICDTKENVIRAIKSQNKKDSKS